MASPNIILTSDEMKRLEETAFTNGVAAAKLMDEVGRQICDAVRQFFPKPGYCEIYVGKGNNGGDALVAARHLIEAGWAVELRVPFYEQELGQLPRTKLRDLKPSLKEKVDREARPRLIIDGLLGLGATGELREPIRAAAEEINRTRQDKGAYVFSIDLPTGLDSETGTPAEGCVEADCTVTAGFVKTALVADEAERFVGRLMLLPLADLTEWLPERGSGSGIATTGASLAGILPRRPFNSHKTQFGRIGIVAGARGTTGAAVLTSGGALHGGGGLISTYAREDAYAIIAASSAPEVMVRPVRSYLEVLDENIDVLALGPGLGMERVEEVLQLIRDFPGPMVVDADGLNILSHNVQLLRECKGPRLLTPHPGEMDRLCINEGLSRRELVEWFTLEFPVTLLLKGARTIVAERGGRISYNTTGNPGMSTPGMGDVLTGLCAALIGQGLSLFDAARVGAWLSGRAAELSIFHGAQSQESFSATRLFARMGAAFGQMRAGCY